MEHLNSENYSPFEVLTEKFGESEVAWDEFSLQVSSLPQSVQDLILGVSAEEFVLDTVKNFNLSEYQSKNLALIIGYVLLGKVFISDLMIILSKGLATDEQTAQQIKENIINNLFAPAIEDIKKIQREKFTERVGQGSDIDTPQPPAPPNMKNSPPVNQNNIIDLRKSP